MRREIAKGMLVLVLMMAANACDSFRGPDKTGEIRLSSEKFGATSYHLIGYNYEDSEFYRYPYQGDPFPDIINEGYRVIGEEGQRILPGFNTPGQMNGFALVGEFENLDDGREYYENYREVEDELQFETVSDTVELYQVWVQQTEQGNYAKLLVKDILHLEGTSGIAYNDVVLDYTYQPDGSTRFPD